MSTIRIRLASGLDEGVCCICVEIQLLKFRNEIVERWNDANQDGKNQIKEIKFEPYPNMLWEMGTIMENGDLICITHKVIQLNQRIAYAKEQQENGGKPRLEIPGVQTATSFIKNIPRN